MPSIFNYFFFFSVSCSILSISPFSLSLLTSHLYFLSWLCLSLSASYSTFLLLAYFTLFFAAFASLFSPLKKLSLYPFSTFDLISPLLAMIYFVIWSHFYTTPRILFSYPYLFFFSFLSSILVVLNLLCIPPCHTLRLLGIS